MAIKLSQSLKQTQSLMMTPQLQQAIKLLTLSHMEMTNVIAEEMVENPMLEEMNVDLSEGKVEADYKLDKLENQNKEADVESFQQDTVVGKDDFDWDKYLESYNSTQAGPAMSKADLDELPNYENIVSKGETLAEHLEWQLRMEDFSKEELLIGEAIIHNLNGDGYLETTLEEISKELGYKLESVQEVLEIVQRFDPVGCGARNLVDCLLAQAKIYEDRSPLLEKIIRDHLGDLKHNDTDKIAKTLGVSIDAIRQCQESLLNFHPKPGRLIATNETHYVVPDIYVAEISGVFSVLLNDEGVPRLKISNLYQSMLKNTKKDSDEREYVEEKLKSAMWLIKSIQNRRRTIIRVSEAIVSKQQEFFKKGAKFLRPMILKDVANEIGMHESTVSRVTTNKYMHTPIGMFELKYFFNAGLGGKNGGVDISSEALKLKIRELVENENPKRPLSDQKIADLLSRDDVKVARRTVAKYRESLDIPSSSKRKRKD
ncbi:RNA polymerase factor sigma-54 [bacterium]|nr:RNA polymerase factor sigma-54 [bacterium]